MAAYDDLGRRQSDRFRVFATAVAGERALAVAAGLPPGSLRQFSRSDSFRRAFVEDLRLDLIRFQGEFAPMSDPELAANSLVRIFNTVMDAHRIASSVVEQSNRQAAFGKANPLKAIQAKKLGVGAIGLLAQRRLANPDFKVRDTSGRQWDGEKLIDVIVRDCAYQMFIDGQIAQAKADGAQFVTLDHPNDDHPMRGLTLQLNSPDWQRVRDETFHVNSNLTVLYGSVQA